MFVITENCLRSTINMFVFDEQVNHVKQNKNKF